MSFVLREIIPDGSSYAYSIWRLSTGEPQLVYITQAEYDDFVVTRGAIGEPAGRPTSDAVFLMAAGGIPGFTTGRPQRGDFWVRDETTREVIVYLDSEPEWQYGHTVATEPLNRQSRETGNEYGTLNHSLTFTLTRALLTKLRAGTLTRTFGRVSVANNVVTVPAGHLKRREASIDRMIPNHRSVTFDASSHGSAFASSFTVSHTVASQPNLAMIAGMGIRQDNITSIVYNGSTLTPITSNYWVSGNDARASTAQMVAPSTGTHNLVYTAASSVVIGGAAISAYGVDQTTPISNSATAGNGSSTAPSVTITSATDELAFTVDVWHINGTGKTCTNDATWTSITQENPFGYLGVEGAYITGASSVTRTDTLSAAAQWAMIGSSLKAASGGNVTTTQTITGVSRIQATTTQTITGVSRIQVSTTQTITGTSRIQTSATQTITGTSRIQAPATQTITGTSRIQNTSTQTIDGVSRIQATSTQTITGVANIIVTTTATQTITGTSRIQTSATQTITGVSRVQNTSTQTITGVASITNNVTTTQNITGVASIRNTTTQTITGTSRIQVTTTKTITGVSAIVIRSTQTITGTANIQATTTRTITGVANIIGGTNYKAEVTVSDTSVSPLSVSTGLTTTVTIGDISATILQGSDSTL